MVLCCKGRLLALPSNIILGRKFLSVTNSLTDKIAIIIWKTSELFE